MSRPSSVNNKRSRPVPSDYQKTIADVTLLAKKRAISLLDKCLNNHHLNATEQRDLILDVSRAFELAAANQEVTIDNNDSDADGNPQQEKQRISTRICIGSSKESLLRKKEDDHNEVCEVCEKGGDLLCCDTCSLVFHLGCIRPKIVSIPKGKWSCAYCVSDGVGTGDGACAKKALSMMGRLSRGLESEDEVDDNFVATKSNKMGDLVIIRSGKRFIVRKLAHSQIVELGRYDNLDDALGSIKPVYKKVLTMSSSGAANDGTVTTMIGAVEDDDLWCTHCMDDPAVAVCAFCGCRTCFGKHNSEYLLLCDYCDQESHTYCLTPQLTEIPEEAWYCGSCINLGLVKADPSEAHPTEVNSEEGEGVVDILSAVPSETATHLTHRVKGRPGRPKKVFIPVIPPEQLYLPSVVRSVKIPGRGRGRPPGSGRMAGTEGLGQPRKYKIPATVPERTRDQNGIEVRSFPSASSSVIPGAGVAAVLAILDNCGGKRHLWPAEKVVVNQFREWSPIEDLQVVHSAFMAQREALLQKILCFDPLFVEPISAARRIKNEALGMSKEATASSSFVKEPPGLGHYSGIKDEPHATEGTSYTTLLDVSLRSDLDVDISVDGKVSSAADQVPLRSDKLMAEPFLGVDDGVNIEEVDGGLERDSLRTHQNEDDEDEGDDSEEGGEGEPDQGPLSEGEGEDEESNGIYPGEDGGKHSEDADQDLDLEEGCSEGDQDNNDDAEDDSEEGQSGMDIDIIEASPSVLDDLQEAEEMFLEGGPTLDDEGENDALSEGSSMGPDVDMGSLEMPGSNLYSP